MKNKNIKFLGIFLVGLVVVSIIGIENVSAEEENNKNSLYEKTNKELAGTVNIGINPYSKYLTPGIECYLGDDSVPGTGKTARQIAQTYKPFIYDNTGENLINCNTPDLYYRVLYGYDPYLHCDTYLVQYILFFRYQDGFDAQHKYDYVPIYVWFLNYGNSPYRVAYDGVGTFKHKTYVWCTGALRNEIGGNSWTSNSNNFMYFPFGSIQVDTSFGLYDYVYMELYEETRVILTINTSYHTLEMIPMGAPLDDVINLYELTDEQLTTWFSNFFPRHHLACELVEHCDGNQYYWEVAPFHWDITDPYEFPFWVLPKKGDEENLPYPEIGTEKKLENNFDISATRHSVILSNVYIPSHGAGVNGLHKDRFSVYIHQLGCWKEPTSIENTGDGIYTITVNGLNLSSGWDKLKLYVKHNLYQDTVSGDYIYAISDYKNFEVPPPPPIEGWPMFHHDPQHTGYTECEMPDGPLGVVWTYETSSSFQYSDPSVADGKVYIGSLNNWIYCFNAETGQLLWRYETEGQVKAAPAVASGKVYVGSSDQYLYCLNADTGDLEWKSEELSEHVAKSPVVSNGKVYITFYNQRDLYCLNADTGNIEWHKELNDRVYSSPAVDSGKVYLGDSDGEVYCLDANTGTTIWSTTECWDIRTSPAVADGKVYIGDSAGYVYCLNSSTGDIEWKSPDLVHEDYESSPAVAYGKVYLGCDDYLYCLNANTGDIEWRTQTNSAICSSPAVADGKVYFGSGDNYLYCLNANTGDIIWKYETGGDLDSSPAIAYEKVYVGGDDYMYCFGEQGNNPPDPPSNLTATSISKTQINLSWNDNSNNEDGFRIYRDSNPIGTVGAGEESYQDTGLTCGTTYTYYVKAYNTNGESERSNTDSATTYPCEDDDSYEDNDTPGTAAEVPHGTITNLQCKDDDWYKFYLKKDYALDIGMSFVNSEGDLDLELYDSNMQLIHGSYSVNDSERVYTFNDSEDSYYYIKVYGYPL